MGRPFRDMRLCLLLLIILPLLIEGKQIPRKAKSSTQREGNDASVDRKDEAGTDGKDEAIEESEDYVSEKVEEDASEKNEDEPEPEDEATDGFRNGYGYKKGYRNGYGYKKGYRGAGVQIPSGSGSGETASG